MKAIQGPNHSLSRLRGSSMMEVLAAILVFSIGMLGFAAVQSRSLKESFDLNQRTTALWQTQDLIDRVRANRIAIDTYISKVGSYDCADSDSAPATACSDSYGVSISEDCSSTEIAEFDSWDVFCNLPATSIDSNTVDSTPIDLNVSLACASGENPCPLVDGLVMTYSWTAKVTDDDKEIDDSSTVETQNYIVEFMP